MFSTSYYPQCRGTAYQYLKAPQVGEFYPAERRASALASPLALTREQRGEQQGQKGANFTYLFYYLSFQILQSSQEIIQLQCYVFQKLK